MSKQLRIWLLIFLLPCFVLAEDPPPEERPAPPVKVGRKGTFYLGFTDPYPAGFGLNITHYPGEFLGLYAGVGMGNLTVYAIGLRFRPVVRKFAPLIGLTWSTGEDSLNTRKGFLSVQTGVEWKWDSGLFLGFGAHWGVTVRLGKSEMKPFIQFGLAY